MKLIDFAEKVKISPETARLLITKEYNEIILSDKLDLPEDIEKSLKSDFINNPKKLKNSLNELKAYGLNSPALNNASPDTSSDNNNNPEVNTDDFEYFVKKNYLIMIDTCSILERCFLDFIKYSTPILKREGKTIIFPYIVCLELKHNFKSKKLEKLTQNRLDFINKLVNEEKIGVIVGDESDWNPKNKDPFADPVLLERTQFLRRFNKNVLVITQDNTLTGDLHNNNRIRAVKSNAVIKIAKLDEKTGKIIVYRANAER